jgi:hypothetical protein
VKFNIKYKQVKKSQCKNKTLYKRHVTTFYSISSLSANIFKSQSVNKILEIKLNELFFPSRESKSTTSSILLAYY